MCLVTYGLTQGLRFRVLRFWCLRLLAEKIAGFRTSMVSLGSRHLPSLQQALSYSDSEVGFHQKDKPEAFQLSPVSPARVERRHTHLDLFPHAKLGTLYRPYTLRPNSSPYS